MIIFNHVFPIENILRIFSASEVTFFRNQSKRQNIFSVIKIKMSEQRKRVCAKYYLRKSKVMHSAVAVTIVLLPPTQDVPCAVSLSATRCDM
jgi:hypothetical protein